MWWLLLFSAFSAAPSGQIAFITGTEQEVQQVCILDLATNQVLPIGPGKGDGAPVWSRDGSMLAFETRHEGGIGINICRPDGSEMKELNSSSDWVRYPHWSPDGKKLAYISGGEGLGGKCTVYDLETGTESAWGNPEASFMWAAWLPNMKLLYALRPDQEIESGNKESSLTLMEWLKRGNILVGVTLKPEDKFNTRICLLGTDMMADMPGWVYADNANYVEWMVEPSPTGEDVAFESNDGGDREIFVLTKKGLLDVSNHRAADWNPVWSPDGQWLAFESFRDGRRGIYRVYPDTSRTSAVAVTPDADNWWPSWAPSGEQVVFVSNRSGKPELYMSDVDGKEVKLITSGSGYSLAPAWRPKHK